MLGPLFLLLYFTGHTFAKSSSDVECMVINQKFVNCSWNVQESAKVNCTFSSRFHFDEFTECGSYVFGRNRTHTGCHQPYDKLDDKRFRVFYSKLLCGNYTSNQQHQLKRKVKLNPPTNLTVEKGLDGNLWFYWNHSVSTCVFSEIRYRINNYVWEQQSLSVEKKSHCINLPSNSSLYELQVRSSIWEDCGGSDFWSDWSPPVFWGSMKESNSTDIYHNAMSMWTPVFSVMGALVLVLLIVLLLYHERLRIIPIPVVPKPSHKFDNILRHHNVEDWLHISKSLNQGFKANFNDRACPVRECKQTVRAQSESETSDDYASSSATDQTESDALSSPCSSANSVLLVPLMEEKNSE